MGVRVDKKAAKGKISSTKKSAPKSSSPKASASSQTTISPKSSTAQETKARLTLPPDASVLGQCPNCTTQARLRRRTFSEQAWTVLLLWNEINPRSVDQAMCDDCYEELRDILIDRNNEMEETIRLSGKNPTSSARERLTV